MIKISIVTISYNQADFLPECLHSVLSQIEDGDEYIVVDPGSTDGSREIISRLEHPNVKKVFESDEGPADGLNAGFSSATGDVFFYLNSDDVLMPGALKKAKSMFEMGNIDVLIGNGFIIDRNSEIRKSVISDPSFAVYPYLVGACVGLQQATYFSAASFRGVGGFNVDNKSFWDGELLLKLKNNGYRFGYTPAPMGAFRIYDTSITGSQRLQEAYRLDKADLFRDTLNREKTHIDDVIGMALRLVSFIRRKRIQYRHRRLFQRLIQLNNLRQSPDV
ncbi:hypothetical protein A3734_14375 [Sulfitobacter sp. HI0054]|uniref:glycosyltransferase n=1 Tax=Sulfitobacter sp. HI0054 TaxID=1822238 RepID=UPI0007C2BCFE|nr:glycosyltransferase [Sulfitobacter sp. HI0054]KZY53805.1 hypothetical protein A3734_14375 [Sulfitobacter sp. HI0054]